MKAVSWNDRVKQEKILHIGEEERKIQYTVRRREVNFEQVERYRDE
jgi:hypothetical protein